MLNMTVETMRIIHDTNVCSLNSSSGIKRIVFRNDRVLMNNGQLTMDN
jgi:hypothetical protein